MELSLWDASLRGGLWLEIKGAVSQVPAVACLGSSRGQRVFALSCLSWASCLSQDPCSEPHFLCAQGVLGSWAG